MHRFALHQRNCPARQLSRDNCPGPTTCKHFIRPLNHSPSFLQSSASSSTAHQATQRTCIVGIQRRPAAKGRHTEALKHRRTPAVTNGTMLPKQDHWEVQPIDKDIFDYRISGDQAEDVLNQRFANYMNDLCSSSSYTVMKFLQRNRFTLYNPNIYSQLNWSQQKPTQIQDKTGLPVPTLTLTIFIDRYAPRRPAFTPFELKLVNGATTWPMRGILAASIECVQFAPPEPFYSTAQMKAWDLVLENTTDQKLKNKMKEEIEERLNLAKTLKVKDATYTGKFAPPDFYFKPCLLELLAPKKPGMPKMMLTSVMSGSLLCFRPHPKKEDGSLVLCHITGASSGMGMLPKAFQRECIKRCSLWKESLDAIKGIGLWGPLQYGGEPTKETPLAGTSTVTAVWSEEAKQWRLFAQIFNAKTDQLAGVVQISGPGTEQQLDQDWISLSYSNSPFS